MSAESAALTALSHSRHDPRPRRRTELN
jgi:hypothetical protein